MVTLVGCGAPLSVERRFAGTVSGTSAACAAVGFDRGHRGTLVLREGTASFAPDDGTLVIEGAAGTDGGVVGERTTVGANHVQRVYQLQGQVEGDRVVGTFRVGTCEIALDLGRV